MIRFTGWWVLAVVLVGGASGAAEAGSWSLRTEAREGDAKAVTALLAAGESPNGDDSADHREPTPLMEAAMGGHVAVMALLVKAGAELERPDQNGDRALAWAIQHRREEAVAWLLARGADPNARGHGGRTALLEAVASGVEPIVDRVIRAGARLDAVDDTGWGAVYMAVIWAPDPVLGRLLSAGINPNRGAESDTDPLVAAAERGSDAKVRLLLAAGASTERATDAWRGAAKMKAIAVMERLARFAPAGAEGLVLSAGAGNTAAVERALTAGTLIDAPFEGMSALYLAAREGETAMVSWLLARGAKTEVPDVASALVAAANDAIADQLLAARAPSEAVRAEAICRAAAAGDDPRVALVVQKTGVRGGDAARAEQCMASAESSARATIEIYEHNRAITSFETQARALLARLAAARPVILALLTRP